MISALVMSFSLVLSAKFLYGMLHTKAKKYELAKTAKEKARRKKKKFKKKKKPEPSLDEDFSYLMK